MADKARGTRDRQQFSIAKENAKGCVVVLHEVWGLVAHTEDVCKRVSNLGFAATAPNLFWPKRKILTPENIEKAMQGIWDLSLEERRDRRRVREAIAEKKLGSEIEDVATTLYDERFRDGILAKAVQVVEDAYSKYGRVSTLGFCFGGGVSLNIAARSRHLRSAVAFYGVPPKSVDVPKISVPMLSVYANHDEIINEKVPRFVEDSLSSGKNLTLKTYPHTRHGFFNDTNKAVHDREAAADAWELTKWFLERTI